jgi:hypothetical protein
MNMGNEGTNLDPIAYDLFCTALYNPFPLKK